MTTDSTATWLVEGRLLDGPKPPPNERQPNIAGTVTSAERPGWLQEVTLDDGRRLRVYAVDLSTEEIAAHSYVVRERCTRHGLVANELPMRSTLGVQGYSASLHVPSEVPWYKLGDRVVNHPGNSDRWSTGNGVPLEDDEVDPYIAEFLSRRHHNRNPLDVYPAVRRALGRPTASARP